MPIKQITRYIAIGSIFLIPVFPLIIANVFFFPFITGKAFYFRTLVEIGFASWVILAFLDAKYRPRFTALTITISAFAVVTLIADLLGMNPIRSIWSNFERMEGWLTVIHLWAFFMMTTGIFGSGAEGKRWWHRWLNTSVVFGLIVAIYGVFQLFGWAAVHQGSTRIDASLGNAAYMAVYMLFMSFISGYLFLARADTVKSIDFPQWIYGIMSVLFAYLLFETGTRGTILGLIGGVMLALGLYALLGKKESKKRRYASVGIIVAILLIGGIFWANRKSSFVQNHEVLNRLASISIQDTKTQARGYIWPMALKGWQQRPIFGWGQENFNYIFNGNYNPAMWAHEQWFDRAHSVFLDWLTASGIVGFAAYLALYVLCLIAIWKSDLKISLKSTLTGLVAGYAVHNIFVFDNLASYVFFFALLGFVNSFKEGKPMRFLGSKDVRADAVEYIVAPITVVCLVVAVYFLNVRPLQAGVKLISSLAACASGKPDLSMFENTLGISTPLATQEIREQLLSCANNVVNSPQYPDQLKQQFLKTAFSEIQAQIAMTPKDARIYALAGFFLNSTGHFAEATGFLEQALRLSPGKQTMMFQLAMAYANTGKNEQALEIIKSAYESAPENPQARYGYASMLIIVGKEPDAHKIFSNNPEIFETEQMAQIYSSIKQYSKAVAIYTKLVAKNTNDVQLRVRLAQTQQAAGSVSAAIETLKAIAKDFPQYKDGVDQAIKGLQK